MIKINPKISHSRNTPSFKAQDSTPESELKNGVIIIRTQPQPQQQQNTKNDPWNLVLLGIGMVVAGFVAMNLINSNKAANKAKNIAEKNGISQRQIRINKLLEKIGKSLGNKNFKIKDLDKYLKSQEFNKLGETKPKDQVNGLDTHYLISTETLQNIYSTLSELPGAKHSEKIQNQIFQVLSKIDELTKLRSTGISEESLKLILKPNKDKLSDAADKLLDSKGIDANHKVKLANRREIAEGRTNLSKSSYLNN